MKILRLSIFNIKKRKKEAFVITFLLAISMALMGVGIINIEKAGRIFEEAFERTGSYRNMYQMPEESYKTEFFDILKNDDRITRFYVFEMLQYDISTAISYKMEDGSDSNFYACFITENDENKIEKFVENSPLSDQEIAGMEHPIWLPYYVKYDMGFTEGDDFILVIGGKEYPFQIAGFYESGLSSCANSSFKCVLTDDDYDMMSAVIPVQKQIAYDTKAGVINDATDAGEMAKELEKKFEDIAGEDLLLYGVDYYSEKMATTMAIEIIMAIVAFISVVTAVSCLFMIRHKITNDIEEQMESIGVLEALGYRSREISGAYIYEYLLLSLLGILIGGILILVTDPLMTKVLRVFVGHDHVVSGNVIYLLIPAVLLIILTLVTALCRAGKIKKYPPVVAFRKGIKTHHFGRNVFPVEKTRSDINRRLGLKGLVSSGKQNVGMFICIMAAALTITFCLYLCDIFRDRGVVFLNFSGFEKALMVGFDKGTDVEAVKQEVDRRDDVRKSILFRGNNGFSVGDDDMNIFQIYAYKNFDEPENLMLSEGRYPVHDNEVLIAKGLVEKYSLSVGDAVLLKYNGIEKSYIVSGTANVMLNNGLIAYMTFDGFRQFMSPTECANYLFVYPAEGVSDEELKTRLSEEYGSIEDTAEKSADDEKEKDLEERIREKADEQMAILKSKYGVSSASYAIKIGDKIISGNSGSFKLTEISSLSETIETQMGGLSVMSQIFSIALMIIIGIVVSIILNFLIESTIRKERQAMGIEKAMGYASNDLRKQIIFRIMPVAIPAIIIGAVLSVPVTMFFLKSAFKTVFGIRLLWIPVAAVIITVYVYVSTYISAGKVKKVSVTELMTE